MDFKKKGQNHIKKKLWKQNRINYLRFYDSILQIAYQYTKQSIYYKNRQNYKKRRGQAPPPYVIRLVFQ